MTKTNPKDASKTNPPRFLEIKPVTSAGANGTGQDDQDYPKADPLLPQGVFRACVVGKSGSGKTQLVANMLLRGWLVFDRIILVLKNSEQEVYRELEQKIEAVSPPGALEGPDAVFQIITDVKDIPSIDKWPGGDEPGRTLLVFDDFVTQTKDQATITDYFVRGRHKGISCIYISQDFYRTPLTIRRNCNYFFLFGGMTDRDLGQLYKDLGAGLSQEEFKRLYRAATAPDPPGTPGGSKHNFFMIDTDTQLEPLKFRKNFDTVFTGW